MSIQRRSEGTWDTDMRGVAPTAAVVVVVVVVVAMAGFCNAGLTIVRHPRLPPVQYALECSSDADCRTSDNWEPPYQVCLSGSGWSYNHSSRNGVCRCPSYINCTHRTYSSDNWGMYTYFCGVCGELGSSCSEATKCRQSAGHCSNDGYCECNKGSTYYDMCRIDTVVPSGSTENIVLTLVLLLILLINKLVSSSRCRRFLLRCRRRRADGDEAEGARTDEDGTYRNPGSDSKTASYTIANTDFIAASDDPDLDWAIELSRQLAMTAAQLRSTNRTRRNAASNRDPNTPINESARRQRNRIPSSRGSTLSEVIDVASEAERNRDSARPVTAANYQTQSTDESRSLAGESFEKTRQQAVDIDKNVVDSAEKDIQINGEDANRSREVIEETLDEFVDTFYSEDDNENDVVDVIFEKVDGVFQLVEVKAENEKPEKLKESCLEAVDDFERSLKAQRKDLKTNQSGSGVANKQSMHVVKQNHQVEK